jgi:hypothetical protein
MTRAATYWADCYLTALVVWWSLEIMEQGRAERDQKWN